MGIKTTILEKVYHQYVGTAMTIFSRYPIGTNVYELEWDVLLILDTCRVDALKEVAPEYDFIDEVGSIISVGSSSSEWMANTFTEEYRDEVENTVYVSANAFAQRVLHGRDFPDSTRGVSWSNWKTLTDQDLLNLDQPWKYAPNPSHGHIRPEYTTDRAIANAREYDPDRLIVHYSQPHPPYTANADREGRELRDYEKDHRSYLRNGGDFDKVWNAYLDNLRMVLDEVEIVLDNIDADTVAISADHGEAFGEWGIYWHMIGLPHPKLKRVPWVVTTATDTGEYEPTVTPGGPSKDVNQHLKDLGYLDEADHATERQIHEAKVPGGKRRSERLEE